MARIFISHSSEDREQAARLLKWLHGQGLASTFLDFDEKKGIAAGADWERTLYREIAACDAVIAILTKNSFNSKWCFVEYAQARALGKAIIPVVETPEGETYVSDAIQHLSLVKDREGGLERLREQLTQLVLSGTGGFAWDNKRPPFPGLLAFEEADAAIYFGRGDDIARLVERLNVRRAQGGRKMVVVLGPSGAGKSSLLRAGLLPRLKLLGHDWIVLPPFRPRLHPVDELAQAIANGLGTPGKWREWKAALEGGDLKHSLSDLGRDLRGVFAQNEATIVVSVDQGEELFGSSDRAEAERFFTVLNALLDENLPFLVLMTLRSDYFDRLQVERSLAADFEEFSLKPMATERWRLLIEGPAAVAGIAVDEELVTAAMADASSNDALPLLAFTLRELYDRSAGTGRMTIEAYRALGDGQLSPLENAVRRKADEVLGAAKPTAEDLQALKEAFIPAMVGVNAEGEYARRPARMSDLPASALPLIERLSRAYLLIVRQEPEGAVAEVAHEALLRKWPRLRAWLDEEREFLVGKEQLEQELREWEEAKGKQKTETLLWGLKLARAQAWLATKERQLSNAEKRFIQASIQNAAHLRRMSILRTVGAVAAVLIVLLGAVIAYQVRKKKDAIAAEASALTFAAEEMQRNQAPVSLAFLADAMRQDPKNDSAMALAIAELRDAELPVATLRARDGSGGDEVQDAEFSPDGSLVVTASADGTARLWDAKTGAQVLKLMHTDQVHTAEFNPSGGLVVTASYDGTARIWDTHTGAELHRLVHGTGKSPAKVYSAHFSGDGNFAVTASADNTARVWDVRTGEQVGPPLASSGIIWDAVFVSDAPLRVATASEDRTVRLWEFSADRKTAHGTILPETGGSAGAFSSVAVSKDGRWIAGGDDAGNAWLWDARTLRLACPHPLANGDGVNGLSFNPAGSLLVTASRGGGARLWNVSTCRQVGAAMPHGAWVRSAVFSANGLWVLTASYDHTARVWDAATGLAASPPLRHSSAIYAAHFNPGDAQMVTTASFDHTARIWRWHTARALPPIAGSGVLQQVCWDREARHVLTIFDSGARLWDGRSAKPVGGVLFAGAPDEVAACSADGRWVALASHGSLQLRDAVSGQAMGAAIRLRNQPLNTIDGSGLRFDPQSRRLATISRAGVQLWDARSGQVVLRAPIEMPDAIVGAAFSPDGNRIATYTERGLVRVWNTVDGSAVESGTMKHDGKVTSASFSPDGRMLVTSSADHTARAWNVETGQQMGHMHMDHWVVDAEFSPDGKWIVTASADFTAQVWNARTFEASGQLMREKAKVNHASFSPDSRWVVTQASDGIAQIWDGRTGVPVSAAFSGLIPDPNRISGAGFSADGNWVLFFANGSGAGAPRQWRVQIEEAPITGTAAPDWLVSIAEGLGGLRIGAGGGLEPAAADEDPALLREKLNALPADDPVSRFGRWLASDPETRPVSPRADR